MNTEIFNFLNGLAGESADFDLLVIFLSNDFGFLLIIILVLASLFVKDKKEFLRDAFFILLAGLISYGVAWILKHLIEAPRPFEIFSYAKNLINYTESMNSFPSGHASLYGGIAFASMFFRPKIGWLFALGALLIGVSRIIVGVHFPIDILVGFGIGLIVGYVVYKVCKKYNRDTNIRMHTNNTNEEISL